MVALRVYDQSGTPYYIDLYEEEQVKLNFSIEDITSTEAKSTFSRVFRVPSTGTNNEFFAHAFLIDGIDYDVTVKVTAHIEIGGAFFRSGHVRLQKIYVNQDTGQIDYELLFLGETRDFASILGEAPLCELDGTSLNHTLNYANVVQSWQAFPETWSSGLLGGDVLYPLVDHGNTYNSSGVPQEAEIKTVGSNRFTQNSHPLTADRFKPMIRAKKIIDLIFAQTGYTYTSTFLNSALFRKIYVSAWGNTASINSATNQTDNQFRATLNFWALSPGGFDLIECSTEDYDPGNNYNNAPLPPPPFAYVAPITGSYTFDAAGYITLQPDWGTGSAYGRYHLFVNGSSVDYSYWVTSPTGYASLTTTIALNAGDYVQLYVETSPNTDLGNASDIYFQCSGAPGVIEPTFQLDCEYKQIDFLKDILKLFRCVMAPDKNNPTNFIIEPWVDYIASGDLYDWSDKVDRTKDFQIEPLFFTQSDEIKFLFAEDEDYLNDYNQKAYKQVYGELIFDSANELLKDSRSIEVGFSPTPTIQIEGDPNTSSWIIPQIHTHDNEGGNTTHLPIKANTRILFYNGLQPTSNTWYFTDGSTVHNFSEYPAVNYQEGHPPYITTGLNLNWDKWFAYYGDNVSGWNEYAGSSLFERYWASYISSLYNKYARRVTANIVLNSVDLQNFTFDDVIYIDGVYYRPEKIIDAPIGEKASVKVQLIKLLDYRPDPANVPPPVDWCYWEARRDTCSSQSVQTYTIQAPCSLNVNIGDYLSVVGDTECYYIIGQATSQIWDFTAIANFGGDCATCKSSVTTPTFVYYVKEYGETCSTYVLPWIAVETVGSYSPGDVVGLTTLGGCYEIIGPTAVTPVDTIATSYVDCEACLGTSPTVGFTIQNCQTGLLNAISSLVPYSIGTVVTLNESGYEGCWEIIGKSSPGVLTVAQVYTNCADCIEANPVTYNYDLESCDGTQFTIGSYDFPIAIGAAVTVNGLPGCWTVTAVAVSAPLVNIINTYTNCLTCQGIEPGEDGIITEDLDQIITETNDNIIIE